MRYTNPTMHDGGGETVLPNSTASLPVPNATASLPLVDNASSQSSSLKSTAYAIKIATPDLIIRDSEVMSIEIMTDLIFEDIGGQELATISRHDLVNGQKVVYAPIKNLTDLYLQYNPNNILRLQQSDSYFKSLSIAIMDHLPVCGNGYDIIENPLEPDKTKWTKVPNCKSIYIDPITGDLVINLINLKDGVQAEVQLLTSGEIYDATIYNGGN
jgi:hypothetical protein